MARRRPLFHQRARYSQGTQSGVESSLHDLSQASRHGSDPRRRGGASHRASDLAAGGQHLPRHRLTGRGSGGRVHRALQRAERWPAAVASLPVHLPHRHRFEHHRAGRRDTLAVQPMTTPSPATTGPGRIMGRHSSASGRAIHLNPGCQGDLAGWPIGSHRDLPLPFHADAPHRRVPAREGQRGPDRALPPGPSRSARPPFPVAGRGDPRTVRRCRRGRLPARDDLAAGLGRRTPAVTPRVRSRRSWEHSPSLRLDG